MRYPSGVACLGCVTYNLTTGVARDVREPLENGETLTMAKQSSIEKHKVLSAKWELLHAEELKLKDLPTEKRKEAEAALKASRVKRRMFKSRRYNRCSQTGRSKGYVGYFGVCRQSFREMAHKGLLPGVTKSSW